MRLVKSLAAGFIPINTWQQRVSLSFKPGVLERKVYNSDDITFFSILTFAKPSSDNVLQPSLLHSSGCKTLSHSGLANVYTRKRMFYPLIVIICSLSLVLIKDNKICLNYLNVYFFPGFCI